MYQLWYPSFLAVLGWAGGIEYYLNRRSNIHFDSVDNIVTGIAYPAQASRLCWFTIVCRLSGAGFVQLQRAQHLAGELVEKRGHLVSQHVVKPTLANLVLWRSVYIHADHIYVDAIRVGPFGDGKVFEGEAVEKFTLQKDLPGLDESSALHGDILRFITFSEGFVAFDPAQQNVLGDMRYSMLPFSARPLWGIVIERDKPQRHADYRFFRDNSQRVRQTFLDMLIDR